MARDSRPGPAMRSMQRYSMPRRASSIESTQPTAPPPTMRTGTSLTFGTTHNLGDSFGDRPQNLTQEYRALEQFRSGRIWGLSPKLSGEELQRHLKLPRSEHCSRRSEKGVRNRWAGQWAPTDLTCLDGLTYGILVLRRDLTAAEIVCSVDSVYFVHIGMVEQVESVEPGLKLH